MQGSRHIPSVPSTSQVMTDRDVVAVNELHLRYWHTRDQGVRDELLAHYDGYAVRLGRRFSSRREERDDLVQVARLALIHAVDRFDPGRERPFVAFAQATIKGELKRHIRDHTWRLRAPRSLQEQFLVVTRAVDDLTHELGRSPRIAEVADRTGLSEEQVLEAMEVATTGVPLSLSQPGSLDEEPLDPGREDPRFARYDECDAVRRAVARLPEGEQRILLLRFQEELTQAEIAARIGVSQMCISRRLARSFSIMHNRLATASSSMANGESRAC